MKKVYFIKDKKAIGFDLVAGVTENKEEIIQVEDITEAKKFTSYDNALNWLKKNWGFTWMYEIIELNI